MANDKKINFKVGEKYLTVRGSAHECIFVEDHYVYLRSGKGHSAYVWDHYGSSLSLNSYYNILPPNPEPIVRWAIIREEDGFHITTFGNRSDAEDGIDLLVGDFKVIKLQEVQE